jgi:hypothetical protein
MRLLHLIFAIFVGALCALGVAHAQGARASAVMDQAHQSESLRPGQWVWAPDASPAGPVVVFVDLSRQLATVYRNAVRIGVATISSGRRRYETPTGVFTVLRKNVHYRSRRYDNAPMPFSVWVTDDGIALHAGAVSGRPASHGCVRLPYAFAQHLFQTVSVGGVVVMTGAAGEPASGEGAGLLAPIDVEGIAMDYRPLGGAAFRWTPDFSPVGPMTIILSRTSQEAVVLRNGIEIGRARVAIPAGEHATRILSMSRDASGMPLWLPAGATSGEALQLDAAVAGLSMPEPFVAALSREIQPGATLLVTSAPLNEGAPRTPIAAVTGPFSEEDVQSVTPAY